MLASAQFVHRVNADETIDSICLRCLETVASVQNPAALKELEQEHVCDSIRAERYRGIQQAYMAGREAEQGSKRGASGVNVDGSSPISSGL